MKYTLQITSLILLTTVSHAFAELPMDNVNTAIAAAWTIVDNGQAKEYESNAVYTREQLELSHVEYEYFRTRPRINVVFIDTATVSVTNTLTSCRTVTIIMDDKGDLDYVCYGNSTFNRE